MNKVSVRRFGTKAVCALVFLGVATLSPHSGARAQSLTYSSGQNVSPAFEGWEQDPDGSKYFLFGYMNRNWEEELDVPVGLDNTFSVGGADQGQPTHFLPRRNRFVFRVKVPTTFTDKDELVWTLATKGKTEKAYATLRLDYKVDDVVKASETGALGAGTSSPEVRANKAPVVAIEGPKTRTAKVGQPLSIVTVVTDDGIPKSRNQAQLAALLAARAQAFAGTAALSPEAAPAGAAAPPPAAAAARRNPSTFPPVRITVGKITGLHLSWFVYRGAGKVILSPDQIKAWEDTRANANSPWAPLWTPPELPKDGRITVQATFDAPGTYVLRGVADDGALSSGDSLTVTVTP